MTVTHREWKPGVIYSAKIINPKQITTNGMTLSYAEAV